MAKISNITLPDGNNYDIRATAVPYGVVDSTSTSTVFTATVPGVTELTDGTCIMLKNSVVTSAANFTININNLGAKPCYNNMATGYGTTGPTRDTTIFNINYTMLFIYSEDIVSGGGWICYRGYDGNTNTIGYQLRTNSTVLKTTDRTRYYRLLFTSADGTHWIPANTQYDNSATTTKTVNTRPINPFGRIVYLGNTTNYNAEADIGATAIWDQYPFNLGYSFNRTGTTLALTLQKPVYVKCALQSDGSVIMDSTEPIVQDLPSTEDGKIYIFLGIAYSATNIELVINHPVYYYKDGAIRLWTNPTSSGSVTAIEAGDGLTATSLNGEPLPTQNIITTSGKISHLSKFSSSQTTQAVYPITFDKYGHIASYGTAVTIPDAVSWTQNVSSGTHIATITIGNSSTSIYAPQAGSAPTPNDGSLKLQKNNDTATAFFSADKATNSILQYSTTTIYHASSAAAFSQGTLPTISTTKIAADDITSWVTNTPTTPATIDTTKFNGGSFTQGADSFTANTPTTIDTTKFSGGSFTRGTFSGGSFTQGTDTFTTNTPTVIDTTKFSGGSFTRGAFTTNTPTSITFSASSSSATYSTPTTLIVNVVAGTSATHAADSFTAANLSAGFYTSGTSASFTQGTDNFTAATHAADSFTSAKLNSGFYTPGTSASFTQGTDSFTSASFSAGFYVAGTTGTAASLSYTAREIPNVTSVGTLPTLSLKSDTVVTGLTGIANPQEV